MDKNAIEKITTERKVGLTREKWSNYKVGGARLLWCTTHTAMDGEQVFHFFFKIYLNSVACGVSIFVKN